MTEKIKENTSGKDRNNKLFWEEMQEIFQQTSKMLNEIAEERGIDLDSITSHEIERRTYDAENHFLAQAALEYSKKANEWFVKQGWSSDQAQEKTDINRETGAGSEVLHYIDANLREFVEVIQWYKYQIHIKLARGLSGDELDDNEGHAAQRDACGSVKVALIGIDRSIGAWGNIKERLRGKTDEILDILLHLDILRRQTEKEFPSARAFIRPGFDTLN